MDLRRVAKKIAKGFRQYLGRLTVADRYLRGEGLEIGALQDPLPLPRGARARYVDIAPTEELRKLYPRKKRRHLVEVDIVDDGETLRSVANDTQDFVVANHFFEHVEDPIATLRNLLRVVRPGGVVYLSIPDKRFIFDKDRETTSFEHLVRDHEQGPEVSRRAHYEDVVRNAEKVAEEAAVEARVAVLEWQEYRIHFHCWTQTEILELLVKLQRRPGFPGFDVEHFAKNEDEMVLVLRKLVAQREEALSA
jgi:predicted SAM-dependent methyltransferase